MCCKRVNCHCVKCTPEHFFKVTQLAKGSQKNICNQGGKLWGNYTRGKTGDEIWGTGNREDLSLASPPTLTGREEDSGTQERKNEGEKDTGRGGDGRESEVVPVWREKALCSLPADRPVKLRRLRATDQRDLQGFAPSSVEAVCQPLPLQTLPAWCPLQEKLQNWLEDPLPTTHLLFKSVSTANGSKLNKRHFHIPP